MRWLAVLLLIAATSGRAAAQAAPQLPTSDAGQVRQSPKDAPADNTPRPQPDLRGTQAMPFIARVILPPKSERQVAEDAADREERSSADLWMVRLTGAIALIGAIQAAVFWVQAGRLKATIKKMDEIAGGQTVDMQASIAQATRAAKAMRELADTAKGTAQRQLRAYVFVENAWAKYDDDIASWRATYRIKNFGATPASRVTVSDIAVALPKEPDQLPVPVDATTYGSLAPHSDFIDCATKPIASVNAYELRTEQKTIILVGRIVYVDAFGEGQWTTFCFSVTGQLPTDGEMDVSEQGNDHT